MGNAKSYVLIQYKGEKEERATLESGGEKVDFKTGDVQFAEDSRAKHLCGMYKFERVDPVDITPEMLKSAQKRLVKMKADREKLAKEQAEMRKKEGEKKEREKEMSDELRALKDKYNNQGISNEEYQEKKEKVKAKWAKIFEGKKKKEVVKEDEEVEQKEEEVVKDEPEAEPVEEEKEEKKK